MSRTGTELSPVDSISFRRACSCFATGVTVATVTTKDGRPFGFTANSFTSVSCSPPLILICIDHRSTALPHFRSAQMFAINVLADTQRDVSVRFAQKHGERFEGIGWRAGKDGVPLLEGALAHLECSTFRTVEAGDHLILIGEVCRAEWRESGKPLLYFASGYCCVGLDHSGSVK